MELEIGTGTPTLLCILLLYPLNAGVNVVIQNPLCHWDITTWCSDDIMISFARKVCTYAWSTEWE